MRDSWVVHTNLALFTQTVVIVASKAVVGQPAPATSKGERVYADWVIVLIHAPREYLNNRIYVD